MLISLDNKALRRVVCFTLMLMAAAHAFCYANLTFSGASVMVDPSNANSALTANGQFLATLYWRVRGALSAPMLVGLLGALFLTGTAVLTADMLALHHPVSLFALCGALTLHISVTAINAAMLHMADVYFLALLFAAAGAWLCLRHPLGFIPAAMCAAASFGLQPGLAAALPTLMLIACLVRVLRGDSGRVQVVALCKATAAFTAGLGLYLCAALLFARRQGVSLNIRPMFVAAILAEVSRAPFAQLLTPATAYPALCKTLNLALFALSSVSVIARMRRISMRAGVFAAVAFLALPFAIIAPVFASEAPTATCERYIACLLPVAMAALLDLLPGSLPRKVGRTARIAIGCAFGVTFLSSIVFANQVYLKKNLEYQTTLSVMTRVVEQAEQTEGFDPGFTPVAIIGTVEDSAIATAHKGFEHLAVLDAAANNYTASTQEENLWYFWEIMGYPFNFVSDAQRDDLARTPSVEAMPAFPQSGFCRMENGTLVIKLSR